MARSAASAGRSLIITIGVANSLAPLIAAALWAAQGSAGAQRPREFATQLAAALRIQVTGTGKWILIVDN